MKIICISLFNLCFSTIFCSIPISAGSISTGNCDQIRKIAIQDFSKTKLFKMDSVFYVTLYDTLPRIDDQRIDQGNFRSVIGRAYPEIIAVTIIASPAKYLLDTMENIDVQNRTIPSRVLEKDGKVFLWRDKHYSLNDTTLNILKKFHLIEGGRKSDLVGFLELGNDDSKKAAEYYFCRSNFTNYKRVVTNKGIGYYDPPRIRCK